MTARVAVSIAIALMQAAIFIGIGIAFFGLQLTGSWPMIVPLLICGTLAFMVDRPARRSGRQDRGGGDRHRQLRRAADGVPVRLVLPARRGTALDRGVGKVLPLKHLNEGMLDTMVRGEGPGSALLPI